jgi:hypothetical protein
MDDERPFSVSVMHSAGREIGTQTSVTQSCPALAQRLIGVDYIMPWPPEVTAILWLGCPGKVGAAMIGGDHLSHLRLLRHVRLWPTLKRANMRAKARTSVRARGGCKTSDAGCKG